MTATRTVITRAKTSAGIARAYLAQYGMPAAHEWSAGGGGAKRDLSALHEGGGIYRLCAVSLINGRPAGVIYGPRFAVNG